MGKPSLAGSVVLSLAPGDWDQDRDLELRALLGTAMDRAGAAPLVVDLSAVTWLDSVALGAFVSARRRLHAEGRAIYLLGARGQPLQKLTWTGLLPLFSPPSPADE